MQNIILILSALFLVCCSTSKNNIEGKWAITQISEVEQTNSGESIAALLFLNDQLEGSFFHFNNKAFSILDKDGKILVEGTYEWTRADCIRLSSKGSQVAYNITEKNRNQILLTDSSKMVIEIHRK